MIKAHSVVLLGDFNPAIFTPDWVRKFLDLSIDDGSEAEVKIIHSEITDFSIFDIQFTIERNRTVLRTLSHDMELLIAVAIKMFAETLAHTPIWAYGLNFERHLDFGTFENRNKLGRILCPLDPWGDWTEDFDNKNPRLNGGVSTVTMKKNISVEPEIYEMFTIQPSRQPDFEESGVFFRMNFHFGNKNEKGKNDEEYRGVLFDHMRENVASFSDRFEGLISHFAGMGGVDV